MRLLTQRKGLMLLKNRLRHTNQVIGVDTVDALGFPRYGINASVHVLDIPMLKKGKNIGI